MIEKNGEIIPVEVKSGRSGKMRSLHLLLKENAHIKKALVLAKVQYNVEDALQFTPIYGVASLVNRERDNE